MNTLTPSVLCKILLCCFTLSVVFSAFATDPVLSTPRTRCPAYGSYSVYRLWRIGAYAGYTAAFTEVRDRGNGGSIKTLPGFEGALFFQRDITRKLYFQVGVGYVSRNFRVLAGGTSFDQRSDRLSVPMQFFWRPFLMWDARWLKRIGFSCGVQLDLVQLRNPVSGFDAVTGVQNSVRTGKKPEVLASVGIVKLFTPIRKFDHGIAVSYAFGLVKTTFGETTQPGQTPFTWQNSGTSLSVKYLFWFTRSGRVTTLKPHPHSSDSF